MTALTLVLQAHGQQQEQPKQEQPREQPPVQDQPQQEEEKPMFPLDNIYAERKPWARSFLRHFHFSLSTGLGHTFFRHELSGFGILQPEGFDSRIYSMAIPASQYTNWVNTISSEPALPTGTDTFTFPDTEKLGFKGGGFNVPLKGTIHYEFQGKYRIGGGYSYDIMVIKRMRPITHQDQITGFQPSQNAGFMRKYFGMLGFSFYRLGTFLFTGDVNVGGFNPGNNFTTGLIKKGVFVNLGVTVEKEFAENFQVFVRPSFELKNYTISIPGSNGGSIVHNINAFYTNVGVTYSLPALPKCYHKDCNAQLNHAHGNREYRSRMHKFYKKQNPMYGENYPKLFKYKGQNKRKLNPY